MFRVRSSSLSHFARDSSDHRSGDGKLQKKMWTKDVVRVWQTDRQTDGQTVWRTLCSQWRTVKLHYNCVAADFGVEAAPSLTSESRRRRRRQKINHPPMSLFRVGYGQRPAPPVAAATVRCCLLAWRNGGPPSFIERNAMAPMYGQPAWCASPSRTAEFIGPPAASTAAGKGVRRDCTGPKRVGKFGMSGKICWKLLKLLFHFATEKIFLTLNGQ